jgi:uncharacterized membrane protein YoaK (UPF0700 family)
MQSELVTKFHDQPNDLRLRDLLLNALTVSSGAVDAISFLALGKVFSAFMTGNIAFFGLRAAGATRTPGAVAIFVSMAAFAIGVYLSTQIVKPSKTSGIWSLRVTFALGVSLIMHTVFLAIWFASNGQPSTDVAHVLLGLWGLAMGMQSAAVRSLHVDGVFTTAATATIIFLVGHMTTWSDTVAERRRLAGVLISLFVGATAGGLLLVHAHIYAPVLPFSITVGVVATASIGLRENSTAGSSHQNAHGRLARRSASSWKRSTTKSAYIPRSATCRRPASNDIKRMPLRGSFLYEFSKASGNLSSDVVFPCAKLGGDYGCRPHPSSR